MKTSIQNQRYPTEKLIGLILVGAFITTPTLVSAQDDNDHNSRVIHQRLLHKFGHNGDGDLTGREAYQARKFHTRWKNSQDGSMDRPTHVRPDIARPDVRPDRVRTDVDRIRDIRVRPIQREVRPVNRAPVRRPR